MLTTSFDADGVTIHYDGFEYILTAFERNAIAVMCKRCDEWDYYGDRPYRSIAEACEAIFYGTILVNRTECGHFSFDMFGNITNFVPLTYYELPSREESCLTAEEDRHTMSEGDAIMYVLREMYESASWDRKQAVNVHRGLKLDPEATELELQDAKEERLFWSIKCSILYELIESLEDEARNVLQRAAMGEL